MVKAENLGLNAARPEVLSLVYKGLLQISAAAAEAMLSLAPFSTIFF